MLHVIGKRSKAGLGSDTSGVPAAVQSVPAGVVESRAGPLPMPATTSTARRLQLTEMQKVCIIMGGLHASVSPFVEQSQPQTIQELLQCPAALSAMAAPARADVSQNQIATVAPAIEERIVAQLQTNERHRIHDRSPRRSYRMF